MNLFGLGLWLYIFVLAFCSKGIEQANVFHIPLKSSRKLISIKHTLALLLIISPISTFLSWLSMRLFLFLPVTK